jgi:hypothetical protein
MGFSAPIIIFSGGVSPPTLSSLNYTVGDTDGGGQSIVLTGTNLASATSVTFGGTSATITGTSPTTCTVTLPAKAQGLYDVVVSNPAGSATLTNGFRYWNPGVLSGADTYLDSNKGWNSGTSTWTDQVSAIDWAPGAGPAQSASQFGTLPSINFSTDKYLLAGTSRYVSNSDTVLVFIGKWTGTDTTVSAGGDTFNVPMTVCGWTGGWCGFGASGGALAATAYNSAGSVSSGLITTSSGKNDGNPHFALAQTVYGTDYYEIYADSTTASTTGTGMYLYGIDAIGAGYGATDDFFNGHVGCVYFGSSFLGSTDITRFYQWSRQRFGVA